MPLPEALLWIVVVYLAAGLLFALAFVTVGVNRVDSAAKDAPLGFRLLLVLGSVALWPILLRMWHSRARKKQVMTRRHQRWHLWMWRVLAPLTLAGLALALTR